MIYRTVSKICFLFIVFGYMPTSVNAQELEPTEDVFSWDSATRPYQLALRDALLGEHRYRKCQMLAVPSFRNEWAIYMIRNKAGDTQIVFKIFEKSLHSAMMKQIQADAGSDSYSINEEAKAAALAKLPKTVVRHVTSIPVATADLLEELWSSMLGRVHYPFKNNQGLDGTSYFFSHWAVGKGYRSGQTWSPASGSHAAALVEIAKNLQEYAVAKSEEREKLESIIVAKAKTLLSNFKPNEK